MKQETLKWVLDAYKTEAECITKMVDYFDEIGSFPNGANILENSDKMIKFIDYKTDEYVEYFVLYKNAEVMLVAPNYDVAEQALVELGFPNRSKAN